MNEEGGLTKEGREVVGRALDLLERYVVVQEKLLELQLQFAQKRLEHDERRIAQDERAVAAQEKQAERPMVAEIRGDLKGDVTHRNGDVQRSG